MNHGLAASEQRIKSETLIAVLFAIALYVTWFILIQGYGKYFLGSDSFIIVSKINESISLRWFEQTYTSQLGIQGIILAAIHNLLPEVSTQSICMVAASTISAITAVVFAMAIPKIYRLGGATSIVAYWLALALSPWTLTFSHSLYWVPFTIVLPFMLMLNKGHLLHKGKVLQALALVFLAMLLKCLCGYEYITTVTLFACAGYVFSCAANGFEVKFKHLAFILSACVAGFIAALSLHIIQLHHANDALGFNTILNRAETHTGTKSDERAAELLIKHLASRPGNESLISILASDFSAHKFLFAFTAFKEYFYLPAVQWRKLSIPFGWFILISSLVSLVFPTLFFTKKINQYKKLSIISLGALLIMAGVFSWQILAWHHMVVHYHLNGQLFAYGIVPLAAIAIGGGLNKFFSAKKPLPESSIVYVLLILIPVIIYCFSYKPSPSTKDFEYCKSHCSRTIGSIDSLTMYDAQTEMDRGMGSITTTIDIFGWASSLNDEETKIYVFVKDELVGQIKPDIPRPDVKAVVLGAGEYTGFSFKYNVQGSISKNDVRVVIPDGKGNMVKL